MISSLERILLWRREVAGENFIKSIQHLLFQFNIDGTHGAVDFLNCSGPDHRSGQTGSAQQPRKRDFGGVMTYLVA
jgi:hypothetical protein